MLGRILKGVYNCLEKFIVIALAIWKQRGDLKE